MLHQT